MRQLVLDTETTGLDPATGDRVIEIAAIELVNLMPTGTVYHTLLDPERDVPPEATKVHGFTAEMLRGKPKFAEIVEDFVRFLGDSEIIAHNAPFDFGFLDAELVRVGPAGARPRADDRQPDAGEEALSRHAEQPRFAVPAHGHR